MMQHHYTIFKELILYAEVSSEKGLNPTRCLRNVVSFFLLALVLVQLGRMSKAMSLLDRLEELNILSSDKVSNKLE